MGVFLIDWAKLGVCVALTVQRVFGTGLDYFSGFSFV